MNTDIVVDKPTDDYIVDMKKGNSNILVVFNLILILCRLVLDADH